MHAQIVRVLSSKRKFRSEFLNKILADPNVPSAIKRKLVMYQKDDKRLSLPKLIADLKSFKKTPRGGAGPSPFANFSLAFDSTSTISKIENLHLIAPNDAIQLQRNTIVNKQVDPPKTLSLSEKSYSMKSALGSGGFGDVYEYIAYPDDNIAVKIFRGITPERFTQINSNINGFVNKFGHIHTSFIDPPFWLEMDNVQGYIMHKCESLQDRLLSLSSSESEIDQAVALFEPVVSAGFIHGDVKLENILVKKNGTVVLHDLDGVYVYDIPLSAAPHEFDCTPVYTHPLFPYFKDFVLTENKIEQSQEIWDMWEMPINIVGAMTPGSPVLEFKQMMMEFFEEIFKGYNNEETTKLIIKAFDDPTWRLQQMKKFDIYSLAASLLYTGLYEKHVSTNSGNAQKLIDKGLNLLKKSFIHKLPRTGGNFCPKNNRMSQTSQQSSAKRQTSTIDDCVPRYTENVNKRDRNAAYKAANIKVNIPYERLKQVKQVFQEKRNSS